MNARTIWTAGGLAALGLLLVTLPARSRTAQTQDDRALARLEQRLADLQERIEARLAGRQRELTQFAQEGAMLAARRATQELEEHLNQIEPPGDPGDIAILTTFEEGPSWLGVEAREVNSDAAKELKLPAERGVVLTRITPDSPAAKAGLKENDVVMEINGQRVEGMLQFRRMIHEIPAGRTAQLTVWRGGRAQSISVVLGKAEERHHNWSTTFPYGDFAFHMPDVQIPDIPALEFFPAARPRLGIDAEDVSGQLGSYFGAPDGEGVLVRDVTPGSAAEKAGLKAGDVIVKFNDSRIRTLGDLRERLAEVRELKTVKLGVLRNKTEMSLDVMIEPPATPKIHRSTRRTNI